MIVQVWECAKCGLHYPSHVRLSRLDHHCPSRIGPVKPAVLTSGNMPRSKKAAPPPPPKPLKGNTPLPAKKGKGKVLKRRA